MPRSQRPHQPRPGGRRPAAEEAPEPAGTGTHSEHGTEHVSDPEGRSEPVKVKVNNGSKVSELDGDRYETVPTGGGKFSAWRRKVQVQSGKGPSNRKRGGALTPEARKARRRRRGLTGAVVGLVLVVALVWAIFFSPLLAVRTIDVQGAQLTDEQEVRAQLSRFEGVPMTRISEGQVMDSVGSLPQVRSVHVMTMPDNRLVVQLVERVPVAAVLDGDSWSLVDQEGTVLRTVTDEEDLEVPVVEGGPDVLGTDDFATVALVLSTLPAGLLEQVGSARAESDSTVELELDGGITVRWGDGTQGALKAEVLAQLVDAAEQTGPVGVYDVSSPEHPVLD